MYNLEHKVGDFGNIIRSRLFAFLRSHESFRINSELLPESFHANAGFSSVPRGRNALDEKSSFLSRCNATCNWTSLDVAKPHGMHILFRGQSGNMVTSQASSQACRYNGRAPIFPCNARTLASSSVSESSGRRSDQTKRKDISTIEDPFDAPTYNIPEKPVTFTEGASYSIVILAGLGVAGLCAYAVFKELIFEPKEYKIFSKALSRVQNDSQVRVRIGSPITGYGQETRNRAARQRIPNRIWTDEFGVEHVEVNFHIRGPHGSGKVYSEMFKDKADKQWKYTYLIVEIKSPSPAQLLLESYIPA
ncbi:probable mitochondrial import inner membrane translocase subunit TIM21 [Aristolochia californica]|uniref:probable mitochondrial import inner membrane translocase subunit TIM21 n=1 Tax=Aristolochia californica TaxID=171875 RepID=UPI0035D65D26